MDLNFVCNALAAFLLSWRLELALGLNLLHGLIFLAAVAPMSMYDLRLMRTFISVNYGLENFADTCCYSFFSE